MFQSNQKTGFNYPFYKKGKQSFKSYLHSLDLDKTDIGLSIFTGVLVIVFSLLFIFQDTNTNHVALEKIQAMALLPSTNAVAKLETPTKLISLPLASNKTKIQEIKLSKAIPISEEKVFEKKISKPKLNQPKAKPISPATPVVSLVSPIASKPKIKTNTVLAVNRKIKTPKAEMPIAKAKVVTSNSSSPEVSTAQKYILSKNEKNPVPITSKESEPKQVNSSFAINKKISEDVLPTAYFSAKLLAEQEGKLLMIKFGADWCLPCKQMEKTTFKEENVSRFMKRNYVKLNVDVEDFDGVNLQNYFQVRTLPTLLIFNAKGKFVAKYETYISAAQMIGILEKHHIAENPQPQLVVEEIKEERIPAVFFNQVILQKTKSGEPITSLKAKAKNWRNIYLNFSTQYVSKGELIVKVKETRSGKIVSEQNIPWAMNSRIADTTTTDFQLDISLKKRKKKKGTYVLEIYHMYENTSLLIGKTTLTKGGKIIPLY